MKFRLGLVLAASLLLHGALLVLSLETTETGPPTEFQIPENGISTFEAEEEKAKIEESSSPERKANGGQTSLGSEEESNPMLDQELVLSEGPSVVVTQEFVTSLRWDFLLLVMSSAGFHFIALLKLSRSNQPEQDRPMNLPPIRKNQ